MARLRVIVLDRTDPDTYRYALWADVPLARQKFYANASLKSVWVDATAADNTALQSGSVTETVSEQRVPSGATLTQIEGFLQTRWNDFQTYITNFNPWQRYGSTWDGTSWSVLSNG
ncbi:MAG: hypothetical protein ACM3IH_14045 [Sphingobacteriales bacterium]